MKIERYFYSEAKAEWEQQLEKMHRHQEALYLSEDRSDARAEDTDVEDESAYMEWISEVMDGSKNTFLADQPPIYTIANPMLIRKNTGSSRNWRTKRLSWQRQSEQIFW